jgi:hypothetical protein
MKLFLLNTTGN